MKYNKVYRTYKTNNYEYEGKKAMDYYQFFDTQIVSYAFKGMYTVNLHNSAISSIVASEFLLLQSSNPKKPNYYLPRLHIDDLLYLPISFQRPHPRHPHNRPVFGKGRTDSVVMEFGLDHEPIIEFSNIALADIINNRYAKIFYTSIQHLGKDQQKILRKRFQFLLDNELRCVPLNKEILDLSFLLLKGFMERHNIKQNFRNSWNDILILATALAFSADLDTRDNELSRFAVEQYAQSFKNTDSFIHLSFTKDELTQQKPNRESKGYINRGWKAKFHH
ncbi:hypothetical protein ccbrp13_25120 [Ktedonobacteria bacterium brp13]|nr:hypothetical protein ccbrp13_25120 [Ktedonobacteria bacterium brp13]